MEQPRRHQRRERQAEDDPDRDGDGGARRLSGRSPPPCSGTFAPGRVRGRQPRSPAVLAEPVVAELAELF
ncbi:MAG: hypothetical protein JO127_09460 [Caulobacteraceae bacterium]|nr:hypothetical protein [Caulobacteraceae bacterium]